MPRLVAFVLVVVLVMQPANVWARTILITNDDGLTSNVVALYRALRREGHDVAVSVPCTNQSGTGGALRLADALGPLAAACRNEAARPGDPGAGAMTRQGLGSDFFYVEGTPVMALLYGLDVVSARRWRHPPDLILSGPNEGRNVGAIILSSGTVSAAQYAAMRGLPAIALSAGVDTAGDDLANPRSAVVARLAVALVNRLDAHSKGKALLPRGLALNVNFPDRPEGAPWRIARIGSYNPVELRFAESLAGSAPPATAAANGRGSLPDLPGLSFDPNTAQPEADQQDDEAVVVRGAIAISPMQPGYEYRSSLDDGLDSYLRDIFPPQAKGH